MVICKLSIHLPDCRGWPWVPPAVRSTPASLAAARSSWRMHAAWKCCKNKCASAINTHIDRVALQLMYWLDWRNGAVELELSKQRLLVTIGKVVAQSKSVSHGGRKDRQKTRFDWCCFYYFVRNSLLALLEALCARASVLVPGQIGWATATWSIQKCKIRIQVEKIGGPRVDTEPTARSLEVWNLSWTGEEATKKGMPTLKNAGFESVEDIGGDNVVWWSEPKGSSKWSPMQLILLKNLKESLYWGVQVMHPFMRGLWSWCSVCGKLWVTVPLVTFAAGFVKSQSVWVYIKRVRLPVWKLFVEEQIASLLVSASYLVGCKSAVSERCWSAWGYHLCRVSNGIRYGERGMIPPNQNYVEFESQQAHSVVVAVPVRFGTLTLMKQHPLRPNRRGWWGPLLRGLIGMLDPLVGER